MDTPTGAPPEAVQKLGELPEFEVTPDGKVLPVQTQATPSPQASAAGAPAEPASPPAEPAPGVPTTPQPPVLVPPAQTVGQPQVTEPVVQVLEPQPAPAPAPEPQPQAQPAAAEPTPEELAAAQERLDSFLEGQVAERVEAALRDRQSGFDKRAAQLDRQAQEARGREQELTKQIRELQTRGLTDEERAKVLATYEQEDERTELDAYRAELVDYHKNIYVESLLLEFSAYGVAREAIEQHETPEEMEAFCYEQKANYLEAQMEQARQVASPPATQTPAPAPPAPQAPAPAAAQPQPQVPAGALAPVDLGTGGAVVTGEEFSQEASQEALRQNLRNTPWKTVRLRG